MSLTGIVQDSQIVAVRGPQISKPGSVRTAFEMVGCPDCIIKQSRRPPHTSNRNEWLMWTELRNIRDAEYMGICFAISMSGEYLIMERLRDLTDQDKQVPAKRPQWANDVQAGNFGVSPEGKVKLRDYGQLRLGFVLRHSPPVEFTF